MTDNEIFDHAKRIMHENMIKGDCKDGVNCFHYTKPSPKRYPYQFFWDTCFHVFILSALGEYNMAKEHLSSLFLLQKEDGFVGHMIYWNRLIPGRITDIFQSKPDLKNFYSTHMSGLVQPPIVAQAVKRVHESGNDIDFLKRFVPKLKKYYNWLADNRDFDGDGLLTIVSPFESGMDWKPTYDVALGLPKGKAGPKLFWKVIGVDFKNYMNNYNLKKIYSQGYFIIKDVAFNTIYAENLNALSELCKVIGDPAAAHYSSLYRKVTNSIINAFYDDTSSAFFDTYDKTNSKIKVFTPTVFYPVVLSELPDSIGQRIIQRHFINGKKFKSAYPLPSVATDEPSFNPNESMYLWRGPTWIVHNWFLHQFLLKKGYDDYCKMMIDSIRNLIAKSGFREYYNPLNGDGYGAKDFTWSCLVIDMIRTENRISDKNSPLQEQYDKHTNFHSKT